MPFLLCAPLCALFCALFCAVWCLSPRTAGASSLTGHLAEEAREVQDAWNNLFESRRQALQQVLDRARPVEEDLSTRLGTLHATFQAADVEHQKLLAMMQISRNLPMEQGLLLDQLQRLRDRLEQAAAPLEAAAKSVVSGMDELGSLDVTLDRAARTEEADEAQAYADRVQGSRRELSLLSMRINYALSPARNLIGQIEAEQTRINNQLPGLWKAYYLSSSRRLLDPEGWEQILSAANAFVDTFLMRMQAQIPHTLRDVGQAGARACITLAFLFGLLFLAHRSLERMELPFSGGLKRLARHSLPILCLGIALYMAAWTPKGSPYLLLVVAGTILLSLGQARLAWDVRVFREPEKGLASPLRIIFLPVLIGLVLLFFNLPPEPLGVLWILSLIGCIWHQAKTPVPDDVPLLEKNILRAHKIMLWVLLGITLAGWGRLSILLSMLFAIAAVCVQQAVGFVTLSNHIAEDLPQKGLRGLLVGLGLALAVPVLLVAFSLSMGLWLLAYPGGSYLLEQAARMDVSLGERSLNFVQILLILSAFYITRSAITVGRFFLRKLPGQNMLDHNLLGPFQAMYTYVLWAVFGLYTLHALGFSLTSLAVVAGGLSVGVGIGMQSIVNNFVSGLILIFGRNIREGDIVDVGGGVTGTVSQIAIRATTIQTFENAIVYVPNANLLANNLTNITRNGRMVRRSIDVGVAYGSDIRKVLELLTDLAKKHPQVYNEPDPMVIFTDFGASTLNFRLNVWLDVAQESSTVTNLRLQISEAFDRNGINIAFPQLDVHFPDSAPQAKKTEAGADTRPEQNEPNRAIA